MKKWLLCSLFVLLLTVPRAAEAQASHFWWPYDQDGKRIEKITLLYGEIEVLASGPDIYFCGVNWPGAYCGIQEPGASPKQTIFSIWDISPKLHPSVVQADERTVHNRFGGEGTGEHTHLHYNWENGKVFKFAVTKQQDKSGQNTLVTFYFLDDQLQKWVLEATMSCPTANDSVRYFLMPNTTSFLENWSGRSKEIPKLCLYRLWAGEAPDKFIFLRKGGGNGSWGILHDSFYLAQCSDAAAMDALIAKQPKSKDSIIGFIKGDKSPLSIPERKLPADTIAALKALPKPNPPAEQKTQP